MVDHLGEQFGDYRLTRKLGGGNFGDVYLGEHVKDKTPAAVKVLQERLTHSEDLKEFINEVRILFRLQHPNIVPLLDFGIERDIPFLIMAHAKGTLRQPKGTCLPQDTVVGYIKQIAGALQCAHDLKLIHRDVKPDNILLGPNFQVWVSDFGIVSIAHSSRSLNTQIGAGTVPYMAPEQIQGKPRIASDQYALGVVVYEWICGSRPFKGTAIEIAMQHSQAQPSSLCEQVPRLSSAVEQVVFKALAKDPKDRFTSVLEFAEAFALSVEQSKLRPAHQESEEQWVHEGATHCEDGGIKEAIEASNHALQFDPSSADAYNNRKLAYDNLKRYKRTIGDYDQAIALNPQDAVGYYSRGIAYYELKQYERAIEDYYQALTLNPHYANAYGGRGLCSYYLKNYWQAIQDFDCALWLDPSITWFEFEREDAYSKRGWKP